MSASRARQIMIAAIAISLLLHLLLAGYLRWPFGHPSSETEIVKVRQITIARIIPHTPPPPTPAPLPQSTPAVKIKVVPPAVSARGTKGSRVARVVAPVSGTTPAPPATPAPTASAAALGKPCLDHDISPAVQGTAPPYEIPPDVRASRASGTAHIQVQIDPQGAVTGATVAQSSGNAGLDGVAMQVAKSLTYTPALVKCKPVASTYTYSMKFVAW